MNAPPEHGTFRRQTPIERGLQLGWRVALSESKRRAKLAARSDADERMLAAEEKRAKRRLKRIGDWGCELR